MVINNRVNKQDWNRFLVENNGSFLQSFEWGEFQKSLNKKVWRLAIRQDDKIFLIAQIIKETFPFLNKSLLYLPFGPTFSAEFTEDNPLKVVSNTATQKKIQLFLEKTKQIAKQEDAIFLLIESLIRITYETWPRKFVVCDSQKRIQPQKVLILDLKNTENEIFNNIARGTRYNIRLAQRRGVKIISDKTKIEKFYNLLKQTSERQKFSIYPKQYFEKLIDIKGSNFKTELFLAEYNSKIVSGIIMAFFNKAAISLHSASDYNYRQLKANSLLRWHTILQAKNQGCEKYDFWGIDEKKWPGLTYHKKTFGGAEFIYPKSMDIVFQKNWHKIYKAIKKLKN